tara:strand:+ start:768 stop:1760 length:993 start_codon:yes stop_codon:yes gene_type:complete
MNNLVLVIGSNSFAGSNFVNYLLNKNCKVIGLSRSKENSRLFSCYKTNRNLRNFKFFRCDLNLDINKIFNIIKKHKPKIIFNFAAQGLVNESWINPSDWYETNIISQVKLFEKIKSLKFIKKYINFSTPEVFGNNKKTLTDESIFDPSTPYAVSREAFDRHLQINSNKVKFEIIITRTANIYGPHQKLYRVVPKAIISFFKKKNFYLDGQGNSKRSFIFMDDVSEALFKIMNKKKNNRSYHISTRNFISIKNLIYRVAVLMDVNRTLVRKVNKDRVGKDFIYKLSSVKTLKNLNWKPYTSLDQGLLKTINWIKKDFNMIKKIKLSYKHSK